MNTIFVSSTFQDMQQERDVLQNSVLPRIKEFAKQYGKNIDLCDLRWGINTLGMSEAESSAKVLQVCFDEIDNARPFFIAILGDNYGWIPDSGAVEKSIIGRNIKADEFLGKSVTEMEIMYGDLKNEDSSDKRFYFREIANKKSGFFLNPDIPKHYIERSAEDKKRMRSLKKKIAAQFPNQVRTYLVSWNKDISRFEGMDAFAEMLYQDIKSMIIQRWGRIPELSEYDRQHYQYQYAIESEDFFGDESEPLLSPSSNPGNLKLNEAMMYMQNYVLVSPDEHSLNALFSSLCRKYKSSGAEIIPYECSQSVLSSSTENMLRYFVTILENRLNKTTDTNESVCSQEGISLVKKFDAVLEKSDVILDHSLILAIRNIHYLDRDNVFEWFPVKQYRHIHFIVTCDKVFSTPSQFKKITEEFYFQDNNIFSRNRLVKSYMARYHKELDQQVYDALLEKSKDKDNQYLELLLQRLLVLSQDDFEAIRSSGDGMERISQYLQKIVAESPENTVDFALAQLSLLEEETSPKFVKAVLAILSILPYGISRIDLNNVLQSGKVAFSTLDMTLLCRKLPTVINTTLDGYYRMMQTPVAKIVTEGLIVETAEWSNLLESYMSDRNAAMLSKETRDDEDEFYRSQYLEVALRTGKRTALSEYLKKIDYDAPYVSSILYRLVLNKSFEVNLAANFENLIFHDVKWLVTELYNCFSDKKMLLNEAFALKLRNLWETVLSYQVRTADSSEENNFIRFMLLYQLGELAYLQDMGDADKFLLEAKEISKENFRQYPNRLWKKLHDIELTDEEKRKGYDSLAVDQDVSDSESVLFGFHGEIEDMEFEQSWSSRVRVINNYLSQIYRDRGNIQAAEALEAESKKLTHISDPDPQGKGNKEILPGITIIWAEELEDNAEEKESVEKRAYKPDARRNSAIQIAKEAYRVHVKGNDEEALVKYEESNEILKEIYEDGKTGKYYDLKGVNDDRDELRKMIQKECARDLGMNFNHMVHCTRIDEKNVRLLNYLDDMIFWAHIYDDYCNNKQSKSNLEEYYLLSAEVYSLFDNDTLYFDRIVRDIDQYLSYRLEAHLNGEQTDEKIIEDRKKASQILYYAVIHNPQKGSQITDFLLRQSNASVKAEDFNGFLQLTYLMENLLKWMWENAYDWTGTDCSLEDIFFNNISNQCMLWEQHHLDDRLKQDAERIMEMLGNVDKSENVLLGVQSVLRYVMQIFRSGEYKDTIPYAELVLNTLQRTDNLPEIELANIYEMLLAMYSEAELLDKAHVVALYNEELLEQMQRKGYTEELRSSNITPSQYKSFVIIKTIIVYLNHAVALSRMENRDDAEKYLSMAESLALKYPEIAASEAGIMQRITLFRKIGLPKPKKEEDSEKVYRKYKNEIEIILNKCMRKEPYDVSVLRRAVSLIEEMTSMPEHEIYKDTYTVAKYYHVLNMLFAAIDRKDLAYKMLQQAVELAESDDNKEALYADIYSDMCFFERDSERRVVLSRKALAIYESLQARGKDYSQNSYAMVLYNASIVSMKQRDYKIALEYVKKASFIWKKILLSTTDELVKSYIAEAQRLTTFLERKISQGE